MIKRAARRSEWNLIVASSGLVQILRSVAMALETKMQKSCALETFSPIEAPINIQNAGNPVPPAAGEEDRRHSRLQSRSASIHGFARTVYEPIRISQRALWSGEHRLSPSEKKATQRLSPEAAISRIRTYYSTMLATITTRRSTKWLGSLVSSYSGFACVR